MSIFPIGKSRFLLSLRLFFFFKYKKVLIYTLKKKFSFMVCHINDW